MFSKISLNTSKSPNGKSVQFCKAHNFAVEWHLKFEVEISENAFEHDLLLFTGAEKMPRLACYLCTI
jgi:hypothetical protein